MACANRRTSPIVNLPLAVTLALFLFATSFTQTPQPPINLNTATAAQLETLPGIGAGLAKRILEYRRKHGPFKRVQDLLIVRGLSVKRYRLLAPRVRV